MAPIFTLSTLLNSIAPESLLLWLARMTLIAALGCAYLAIALRARPATRHMVAMASLVAIAVLPVASALLPTLSLPVLPATESPAMDEPRNYSFAINTSPVAEPAPAVRTESAPIESSLPVVGRLVQIPTRESIGSTVEWKDAAPIVWLNVTVALLLWTALAAIGAHRLARHAFDTGDENLLRECARAQNALGMERAVEVSLSGRVAIPMVVGAFRPRVILPLDALNWSRERLGVVLVHELAHVRRRDGLWMLIARIVTAIFWFHPLVWVLSSHIRREAERACDDAVLASGIRGSDYAGHLVAIARASMTRDPLAVSTLAFATRSTLERRVVSILSTRAPRAAMSRRALASLSCVSLVLLAAIAAVRPTPVESALITGPESFEMSNAYISNDGFATLEPIAEVPQYTVAGSTEYAENRETRTDRKERYYLAKDKDKDSSSGRQVYSEANELYQRHRYTRAAETYRKAAELDYRRETALYNAGCSHALAEEADKAIAALQEAFDEGFDRPDLFASDEDLNSLRGDARFQKLLADVMKSESATDARKDATREFDRLAKRSAVEEDEWNSVGIELLRSGDYERAADAFDREFKTSKDEGALYNMACARALGGQPDAALKLLEQSITTGSVSADHMEDDPDLVTLHGKARFEELLVLAEDLTLWPNGNWNWKGNESRAWKKSLPRFEKVAKDHPSIGRAWFNLGFAQLASDDAKSGTASFRRALDLGYKPSTTMYNLACCAAQSGDIDGAFAWLEQAEGAGMEVGSRAAWDDDLEPLSDDPRFEKYEKKWKKHGKSWSFHYDDEDEDEDNVAPKRAD